MGRSLRHHVNVIAELDAAGVAFVSLKDNLNFSTPAGRLMFNVIAAMAQFERDLIREGVKAGMANARRKGASLGRKRVPVGIAAVPSDARSTPLPPPCSRSLYCTARVNFVAWVSVVEPEIDGLHARHDLSEI